jgi:uncharacterized membrane protein
MLLGLIFAGMGASALTTDPGEVSASTHRAYAVALSFADLRVWGVVFLSAALVALLAALTLHHLPGFVALMGLTVWWAAMLVASWLVVGEARALAAALQWLALTALLATIVGWPDPPRIGQRRRPS